MKLRDYQKITVERIKEDLAVKQNVLIQLPTASGKTIIFSHIISDLLKSFPKLRVLVLVDRDILITQTQEKLLRINSELRTGIACASVTSKPDLDQQVTIASRQTLINHTSGQWYDLIIADEAHLWRLQRKDKPDPQGQFAKILTHARYINPACRLLACTATPYRLDAGYIYGTANKGGLNPYFDGLCHRVTVEDLTYQGHLTPLIGEVVVNNLDLSNISIVAGEYNLGQLSNEMSKEQHITAVHDAIEKHAGDRKKIMIFAVDIAHAKKIHEAIPNSVIVHSQQSKTENQSTLQDFAERDARIIVNVSKLTTGLDIPEIDCIVMARPTLSSALYVQIIGRGLRPAAGKQNCLLIDLTENTQKHCPSADMDRIVVKIPKSNTEDYVSDMTKVCPACSEPIHLACIYCPECNHEFEAKEVKESLGLPETERVEFSAIEPEWYDVYDMRVYTHKAKSGKKLLRVKMTISDPDRLFGPAKHVSEWICLPDYYNGYATDMGQKKWKEFSDSEYPEDCDTGEWLAMQSFKMPGKVLCTINQDGYYNLLNKEFKEYDLEEEIPF